MSMDISTAMIAMLDLLGINGGSDVFVGTHHLKDPMLEVLGCRKDGVFEEADEVFVYTRIEEVGDLGERFFVVFCDSFSRLDHLLEYSL